MATHKILSDLFRKVYIISLLTKSDQTLYCLIDRYKDRVSPRLLKKKVQLQEDGKKAFGKYMAGL